MPRLQTKSLFSKNEILWLTYETESGKTFYITSTALRDVYYLYENINNTITKTKHKSSNPTDLYEYMKG